jgi:hypothetical protein
LVTIGSDETNFTLDTQEYRVLKKCSQGQGRRCSAL